MCIVCNYKINNFEKKMLFFLLRRLFIVWLNADFLSLIILYFITISVYIISRLIGRGRITPYLFLLLFSRRIIVFLLFCSLLYNNKISYNFFHYTILFCIIRMIIWFINPIYMSIINFNFNYYSFITLIIPSLLLFVISVRNLEVALRS